MTKSIECPPVIVTLTPLPVRADSRTYKQAASLARLGFRSIVVEGSNSGFGAESLPFELMSLETSLDAGTDVPSKAEFAGRHFPWAQLKKSFGALVGAGKHAGRTVIAALHLMPVARFIGNLTVFFRTYFWRTLQTAPHASLYYLHSFYQFPAVYLLCLRHRAKFVYDAHDFYSHLEPAETQPIYWRRWMKPFEDFIERACVRNAAAVVTVNDGIADLMRERFGCNPIVLRNAHDRRLDEPVTKTIREEIGLGKADFLIVSIGNWKPGMAIEEVLTALGTLPDRFHLAFLGYGYPSYRQSLQSRRLSTRVHFLKPVRPQQVVPYINSANASILLYYPKSPNYLNALPNRFFQAIAAGLPLIYPPLPQITRLADRYGIGLQIDPCDSSAVAEGIRKLDSDQSDIHLLRANLQRASAALEWEREEAELELMILKLVRAPSVDSSKFPRRSVNPASPVS